MWFPSAFAIFALFLARPVKPSLALAPWLQAFPAFFPNPPLAGFSVAVSVAPGIGFYPP